MKINNFPFCFNFPSIISFLFSNSALFFFIVYLFSINAIYGQNNWADGLDISIKDILTNTGSPCSTGASNCYELRIDNILPNNQNNTPRGYTCFWYFGDGTFKMTKVDSLATSASVFHEFLTNNPSGIYAQLAKRYDDDEPPKKIIPNGGSPNGFTAPASPQISVPNMGSDNIKLIHSLKPKTGDTATYVLACKIPDICVEDTVEFFLGYDNNDKVNIVNGPPKIHAYDANGSVLSISPTVDHNNGEFSFIIIPSDNPIGGINAFVDFEFKDVPPPDVVPFEAVNTHFDVEMEIRGIPDSNSVCDGTLEENDIDILSVKSHDPNIIIPDVDNICPTNYPGTIKYTIIFQNIGSGPATEVVVKNILPPYFIYNSVKTLNPTGLQHTPLNQNTRELEWRLTKSNGFLKMEYNTNELRGTGQPGYEIGSNKEHYTLDTIEFSVEIDPNKPLPPCGLIINRAKIYFDNNSPIVTNDSHIEISCTNCGSCTTIGGIHQIPPIPLIKGSPIKFEHPAKAFGQGTHTPPTYIYPPVKMTALSNDSIIANITKPGTYTVVSTSGCSRSIMEVPVYGVQEEADIFENCNWWTCELSLWERPGIPPPFCTWIYKDGGTKKIKQGNSLNFTRIDSVRVAVKTSNGKTLTYTPCVLCWKNILLKYWWCFLIFVFLLLLLIFRRKKI